ncbi:hypothetical protein [Streptomyces sp. MA15]|nr:hypothetical protein [Streptomyces sp. MA15]MDN3270485.1 hypothetical protein [Streptomyces sp. MA15]
MSRDLPGAQGRHRARAHDLPLKAALDKNGTGFLTLPPHERLKG